MRTLAFNDIVEAASSLCVKANLELPADVLKALESALASEDSERGCWALSQIVENAAVARCEGLALCQDTGFAVFFAELGNGCCIEGGTLQAALDEGVRRGYAEAFLRPSIVSEPAGSRANTGDNSPAFLHLEPVPGEELRLVFAPKGGGSENQVRLKRLAPDTGPEGVASKVLKAVLKHGAKACPPLVIGIGIGGTAEAAVLASKKAVALRPLGEENPVPRLAALEAKILKEVNDSGIGPGGLGGRTTALAVHIAELPTHIACLPVAVNLQCHSLRRAEVVL